MFAERPFSTRQKFRNDWAGPPRGLATSRFLCIVLMIQYLRNCLEENPGSGDSVAQASNKKAFISRFDREPLEGFVQSPDTWQNGSIELISTRAQNYEVNGRALPLNLWPKDAFGMRTIPLPKNQ